MSEIDLERLRVRQSYFIPIRREKLAEVILKELEKESAPIGIPCWDMEEHGNSFSFSADLEYSYIVLSFTGEVSAKKIRELSKKYDSLNLPSRLRASIGNRRACYPFDIYVNIIKSDERGCEIEVECLPTLYRQISQLGRRDFDEPEVQDAYITCERYLRTLFLGGLSGTLISEKKITPLQQKTEFLINDVSLRQITEKLDKMLDDVTGEILILGWMGTFLVKKLRELREKGIIIKIITGNVNTIRQDPMRKEKETAMKELISIIGKDHISIRPDFHGRAVVVDNKALIGSMDLDSYSLTGTRIELAMYTEDSEIVRCVRNHFNKTFAPLKEEEKH